MRAASSGRPDAGRQALVMVSLELRRPHWIEDAGDDPSDQCAHGFIELSVNGIQFVSESDGEWTVSAAALFLLRTVTSDHSPDDSVAEGNFLIPCCGFNIWPSEDSKYPYYILGCNNGIDPSIRHIKGMVYITLEDKAAVVPLSEWAEAVLRFSDQVQEFYDLSEPKEELTDDFDRPGWDFFWQDWKAQRQSVRRVIAAGTE
jgi:hypothetical protein